MGGYTVQINVPATESMLQSQNKSVNNSTKYLKIYLKLLEEINISL